MPALQIYDRRERAAVAGVDAALRLASGVLRPIRRRTRPDVVRRILLLRLERIGDLLMTLGGIADIRAAAPDAHITLVVGGWNSELARTIASVNEIETASASWLARGADAKGLPALLRQARGWRRRRFDLAINFEPDIRSNAMLALSGARWTAGYRSGGGGPLLDVALDYRPTDHTADNARRLVATVLERDAGHSAPPPLALPDAARRRAAAMTATARAPLVAMHVPGGRLVKQWDPERFAAVARTLVQRHGATIVLTGSAEDRDLVTGVRQQLPHEAVIDASSGLDLVTVAALLERCELIVTGDTGPMHLAAAVGTPIVAIFGPSDPARYGPRGPLDRVVRIDLPCAPCNRIRLPPARCTGRIPDCLALLPAERVVDAATAILDACAGRAPHAHRAG